MPPRRSHKKSRAGCRRCKIRKIKCDEIHPRCGNCVKHGVSCDFNSQGEYYDDVATPAAETPRPSISPTFNHIARTPSISHISQISPGPSPPPSALSSLNQASMSDSPDPADRMLELRLMHHFTAATSKTLLINSGLAEEVWQRTVPALAFTGKTYLANAMLSVAALHLRYEKPDDTMLIQASHAYAASTLAEYCKCLDRGITPENAEALFLTASLIAFQATASRVFSKDDLDAEPGDPSGRYALPMAWFHAFQGVKTVTASSWQWIRNSSTVKAVIDSQPGVQLDMNSSSRVSFFSHLLEGVEDEVSAEDIRIATITSQAYSHAISVLNWAHKSPIPAAALAFPATVSRRFIDLVECRRPRALAILACFFALLKRMDNVWWLHDVSRREVMGLVGIFESGSKWWKHLEWPVRIALWDSGSIPTSVWGVDCEAQPLPDNGLFPESMRGHIEVMSQMATQPTEASLPLITDEADLVPASPD